MGLKVKLMHTSRMIKYNRFLEGIKKFNQKINEFTILDVGVNTKEYSSEDNFLIQNYPHQSKITGLSVENHDDFRQKYPLVNLVIYDGETFPFNDESFDFIHSNAVIEHVCDRNKQIYFLDQMIRVAKKMIYFTTPNRFFPIEMHTNIPLLHYLPKKYFDRIISKTSKKWATGDYMNLLSYNDLEEMTSKYKNEYKVNIYRQKILGFTYQLIVIIEKN